MGTQNFLIKSDVNQTVWIQRVAMEASGGSHPSWTHPHGLVDTC